MAASEHAVVPRPGLVAVLGERLVLTIRAFLSYGLVWTPVAEVRSQVSRARFRVEADAGHR